ncbi:MAG: family 10 glycosylhydrolase [Bacteroidales bacterium]|nr:family 10 glycosylhydrolase [Bacteroidales bacterium]
MISHIRRILRFLLAGLLLVLVFACEKEQPFKPGVNPITDPGGTPDQSAIALPKKELRGAWMATAWEIDYPQGARGEAAQKEKYRQYLDLFEQIGINAVFFQIRAMADSYYESLYEPWSKTITGTPGQDPGYDILKFLVDETHARGMQFHAWINPYRISTGSNGVFPELDPRIPKELTKDYRAIRIYNPALPEVRDRIAAIVKEIITKYHVDGLHMDDYFYPSLESWEAMNDDEEYEKYGGAFSRIEDFRRDNISKLVQIIQKTIIDTRPEVIFSISPQGNYDNNYNTQYIDVATCAKNGWIDVLIPQLYWTGTTFSSRLQWFTANSGKSHLMVGYGIYRYAPDASGDFGSTASFNDCYNLARSNNKVKGCLFYNSTALAANKIGITDAIRAALRVKVLMPYLGRTPEQKPGAPTDLNLSGSTLTWEGHGSYYAVYKLDIGGKRVSLSGTTRDMSYPLASKGTYFVTALDDFNAESELSEKVVY